MPAASISSQKNDRPSCKGRGCSHRSVKDPSLPVLCPSPCLEQKGSLAWGHLLCPSGGAGEREQLFPSLGLGQGSSEPRLPQLPCACSGACVPAVVHHDHPPHPSAPQATPPLPPLPPRISGVLIASRIGGEGASLESEDWSLQPPLVRMESSLLLASSSPLSCLVSPFIVSCRKARVRRVAEMQGWTGAVCPQTSANVTKSSGQERTWE